MGDVIKFRPELDVQVEDNDVLSSVYAFLNEHFNQAVIIVEHDTGDIETIYPEDEDEGLRLVDEAKASILENE